MESIDQKEACRGDYVIEEAHQSRNIHVNDTNIDRGTHLLNILLYTT